MFGAQSHQKSISEQTAYEIDEEVRSLLNEAQKQSCWELSIKSWNPQTDCRLWFEIKHWMTIVLNLFETGKMPETVEENPMHYLMMK